MKPIVVTTPATTSNLGAGFDCLGMALRLYNRVEFTAGSWRVEVRGEGEGELPTGRASLLFQAAARVFRRARKPMPRLDARCVNRVPVSRGLGSSATAIVAGLLGANALLGGRFERDELLRLGLALEPHPDNLAPCLFGGLVAAVKGDDGVTVAPIRVPRRLGVVVAVPELRVSTERAREILPRYVSLENAVFNLSRTALFVAACEQDRLDWIREATQDRLHALVRAELVPGAMAAIQPFDGVLASTVSGSGSALLYLVEGEGRRWVPRVERHLARCGLAARVLALGVDRTGARVSR
ncbi:MAG: homoserine kinase [Planctomycetota bacterium]